MCYDIVERQVTEMPNAAEIIKELAAKLELYRMFAMTKGFLTDEAVAQEVAEKLQVGPDDDLLD